ncbi:hypothetical protein SOVF_107160 isoform B [Spinacia oleracea]|nr:hypothetical protein SOVF_107160 isoform B [Spinacia oleracea]
MAFAHCTPFSLSSSPKLFNNPQKILRSLNVNHISPHSTSISTGSLPNSRTPRLLMANERETSAEIETSVIEKQPQTTRFEIFPGNSTPLGAVARDGGVNFAIFSENSVSATLCLITLSDFQQNIITEQISLDPLINKTRDTWHVFLKGNFDDMLYGYKFDGPYMPEKGHYYDSSRIILDPYAKAVISRGNYGELGPEGNCWPQMAGMIPSPNDEELGINCLELMPCHEFNELEYYSYNSAVGDYKMNFWGYSTINYFSPMIRYASSGIRNCGREAINEFKLLVREAHKRDIEVIMDVVFNHTAEGNEKGPIFSFRGTDNRVFYMLAPQGQFYNYSGCGNTFNCNHDVGQFYNYSGCGNTFNCNHDVVSQFIVDSLKYWVTEMHVDGFRFDLASILTRSNSLWNAENVYVSTAEGGMLTTGTPLGVPPVLEMISNDPVLRRVKADLSPWRCHKHGYKWLCDGSKSLASKSRFTWLCDAWDCGGLYQVGVFPHWGIWSEWNGKYRDMVRLFIKGTDGFAGAFAECLCGSPNLYKDGGRRPWHSINFVCAHDGFTLADLVTYNDKNNLANGENNEDGENHNNSWNCGQEGEPASISVKKLRKRQMRNFFLTLMVSQGVPMIYMGDEYGHTKGGNNNSYCHDNDINYFRWDKKEAASSDFFRFCHLMTKFRSECESLGLNEFPTSERLQWHGHLPDRPDWSETSRFVAFTLKDLVKGEMYVAFNTSHLPANVTLPDRPGYQWEPLVDTSKPTPFDFFSDDVPQRERAIQQYRHFLEANFYPMLSYSSIILLLKPDVDADA